MRTLTISLFVLLLSACRVPDPSETLTDDDKARIEQQIVGLVNDILDRCSTMDAERCFPATEPNIPFINNGRLLSMEEFGTGWRAYAARHERQEWYDRGVQVLTLSPTIAIAITKARFFNVDTLGVPSDTVDYAATMVYGNVDGEWQAIHGHESHPPLRP